MFMVLSSWPSHYESSPGSFDECRMVPSACRPKTKPDDLGCESACTGCQKLHPPSPFIITQPESWYSFYHPTKGRRLSRPSWLVTYRDGLSLHRRSPIRILTGSDVAQLSSSSRMRVINHNWSATKQRLHPQSVAEISRHSVLSGNRIRQCETSSGSRHKGTDQCL